MALFKSGDTVYREQIVDRLEEINFSGIRRRTREEIKQEEAEKDELMGILDYMTVNKLTSFTWKENKIRPRYTCSYCGKKFFIPDSVQECVGEYWGTPAFEWQSVSPCCHDYFYEEGEDEET